MKALLIGCGQIGALADLNSDSISTHAKAYFSKHIPFDVYDVNPSYAQQVSSHYNSHIVKDIKHLDFSSYDIVSVCSPTNSHFSILEDIFRSPPKVLICEKPIDSDISKLSILANLYRKSSCKVIVNAHRSFNPSILKLSQVGRELFLKSTPQNIVITYQRGIHNNCIHAFDLIETLLGEKMALNEIAILAEDYDEFSDDPTISAFAKWNNTNLLIHGLKNAQHSFFELDIFFRDSAIRVKNAGNSLFLLSTPEPTHNYYPKFSITSQWNNCMNNAILHTLNYACQLLDDRSLPDNFLKHVRLSSIILGLHTP